ncbi:YwmB family TATA-box binding protein [Siminovitchia sp. 179-K 8D1 HS]|uniref:YwmB family TATA-box binding protein n=1 Tax=Siminovitchia sp. 179-K 8D1 HS TaxID=3142385 RepID=UPI0039A1AD88
MRKKHLFIFLQIMVMISLIASLIGNNTNAANLRDSDMDQLVRGISHKSGTIIEWSLYTRETIDLSEKDQFIHNLKSQFPEWVWTVSSSNDKDNVTARLEHDHFLETIKVVTMEKDGGPAYLSYEMTGETWNSRISRKSGEILQSRIDRLFKGNMLVFSCIKGVFNEDDGNLTNDLLRFFQAEEKEALKEKGFYSISAYSSLFSQSISLTEQKMNLQLGLRKNRTGRTSFVIGTPILTNEY